MIKREESCLVTNEMTDGRIGKGLVFFATMSQAGLRDFLVFQRQIRKFLEYNLIFFPD